jgi:DNA replication protein DnaC
MRNDHESLKKRAQALKLHGLIAHWSEVVEAEWLPQLIEWEEALRQQRSLDRRVSQSKLGRFRPLCDFDWGWPKRCDRGLIESLMSLDFMHEKANVILIGPNGVGKTMIAQNIVHQALIQGAQVLFTTAGNLLNELAAIDSDSALNRRLNYYAKPQLLVIDEVGYLSYSNRSADLLFELMNRRYEKQSTVVTTNRPFSEWAEVFPNAACVTSLIDRLMHHAEVVGIEGDSYRLKEAMERQEKRNNRSAKSKAKENGDETFR